MDPLGLATAIVVGGPTSDGGGDASSNPLGHVAIAVTGRGVYSYGTSHAFGSNFIEYLLNQVGYRDTTVIIVDTTPEQEASIIAQMKTYGGTPYGLVTHNCATAVSESLWAANLGRSHMFREDVPPANTPIGVLAMALDLKGATTHKIPRGRVGAIRPIMNQFNPR